jgi:hypothetical protein
VSPVVLSSEIEDNDEVETHLFSFAANTVKWTFSKKNFKTVIPSSLVAILLVLEGSIIHIL